MVQSELLDQVASEPVVDVSVHLGLIGKLDVDALSPLQAEGESACRELVGCRCGVPTLEHDVLVPAVDK